MRIMPVDRSIVRGVLGLIAPLALSFFPIPGAAAEDLLPADKPIPEAIDHYLAASLAKANVSPAQQVEDATYLRRVMLDLVGRIPTPPEAKAFAESQEPDKRAKLVDELMASPSYARYQAYELDLMLMPSGKGSSLKEYLNVAVTENRSWDRIFRELLQAEGAGKAPAGAELFLKERVSDLDKMTNDVSILFFGVNIGCAMCHDHPLVGDWSQGHFYGMKSFFSRSYEVNNFVGERSYGGVTYKTTDGESRDAKLMFLTGEVIAEPAWKEPNDAEKKNRTPKFHARPARHALARHEPGERDHVHFDPLHVLRRFLRRAPRRLGPHRLRRDRHRIEPSRTGHWCARLARRRPRGQHAAARREPRGRTPRARERGSCRPRDPLLLAQLRLPHVPLSRSSALVMRR